MRLRRERKDHVSAYEFVEDQAADAKKFRMLTVVDAITRECSAIDVGLSLKSDAVLERLSWLFVTRSVPEHIGADNGPEFTAKVVRGRLGDVGVRTLFVSPGSPCENEYVESVDGKLGDELLECELFYTLKAAKVLIKRWRVLYNTVRPHSSLGYRPRHPRPSLPARLLLRSRRFGSIQHQSKDSHRLWT